MSALFRRRTTLTCFFCQSPSENSSDFKCLSCGCWNRFDLQGNIISEEPAMHDERLNIKSFTKRASPRKDRFLTKFGPGPFCQTCRSNQALIVNILSGYLPKQEGQDTSLLEDFPAYEKDLYDRYPPVCDSCLPQVEEEIRNKEQMARSKALGGWLRKGKERRKRVSTEIEKEKLVLETIFWWKVRGYLWAASYAFSLSTSISAAYSMYPFRHLTFLHPVLPFIGTISLLWTAWDPTYASFRKAQLQGRDVRIRGKSAYNIVQVATWIIRMISSTCLAIRWFHPESQLLLKGSSIIHNRRYLATVSSFEVIAIIISGYVLRIQQPPAIRLVDTRAHRLDRSRSGTPNPHLETKITAKSADFNASSQLFVSSKGGTLVNPIFGVPSLQGSIPHNVPKFDTNDDEMDWAPTNFDVSESAGNKSSSSSGESNWLHPQRFFAPEKPTGLEGLLEGTRIQDEQMDVEYSEENSLRKSPAIHLRKWASLYLLLLLVAMFIFLKWSAMLNLVF